MAWMRTKELIEREMAKRNETLADIEEITLSDADMHKSFCDDFRTAVEGKPFTAWTLKTVYFPVCYDGAEWGGSVSRPPDGNPTAHQGGLSARYDKRGLIVRDKR